MTALTVDTLECRIVTPKIVRGQLKRLACWVVNGHVDNAKVSRILATLTGLDENTAVARFIDLVDTVAIEDAFQQGILHRSEIIDPDTDGRDLDEQADDACCVPVGPALDELMAGVQ